MGLKNSDYVGVKGGSHSGSEPEFAQARLRTSEKYKSIHPNKHTRKRAPGVQPKRATP